MTATTVERITSFDGSVNITPSYGVGDVDLSVTPASASVFRPVHRAANFNAIDGDVELCDLTGGPFAGTLPAPTQAAVITFKKLDGTVNALTITPHAGEKIDGANSFVVNVQWVAVILVSDGTDWFAI